MISTWLHTYILLGVGCWFAFFFCFGPPECFSLILLPIFSSVLWVKVPRKILQENTWLNPPNLYNKIPNTFLQRGHAKFCWKLLIWCAGTTPILRKKRSEKLGWKFGLKPIPRVAPRVAPRIAFFTRLGRECNSESCSENSPEFRELLREWPLHSESSFCSQSWGGSLVSSKRSHRARNVRKFKLLWSSKLFRIGFYHFWMIYRNFFPGLGRMGNIYRNSRESTENEGWESTLRGTPRITGLAPVRIIYRKKLRDRAFCEIIR